MKNLIYKALDLYELSTRDWKEKEYTGYTDTRNQYAVLAYIISSEELKKVAINKLLTYIKDTTVTWKVLLSSNNYVVGLFDLTNKSLVEGTLMFGPTKSVLEDFNKKISTSRYSSYFQNAISANTNWDDFSLETEESIDFGDVWEVSLNKGTTKTSIDKFTIGDLRGNLKNSRDFLLTIATLPTVERVKKMWEVTEAFETYRVELEKENISDQVIDDILNLSFGWVLTLQLQEKALDYKAKKMRLSNLSKSSKRDREAVLQDV